MLGGARYWANSGAAVDVESNAVVCQVKHRARGSLAELEAWAVGAARQGAQRRKLGVVAVKRRAGRGRPTPWLFVLTEGTWQELIRMTADPDDARPVPGAAAPPGGR